MTETICIHQWEDSEPIQSTGPNLFGKEVTCWGIDMTCALCDQITWRRIEREEHDKQV